MQLLEKPWNVNNATSIVGYWVFDSIYEKSLWLTKESLDLVYSPYYGEEQVATFDTLFYALDTFRQKIILKLDKHEDVSKMNIQK